MTLHGVPFDNYETVGDFMARVRNVVPDAVVTFVGEPKMGAPYVLIKVERELKFDSFTLTAEPGDTLRVLNEEVWITRPD